MSSFIAVNLNSNTAWQSVKGCKNDTNVQHFNEFECSLRRSLRRSLWNKLFKLLIVIIEDVSK